MQVSKAKRAQLVPCALLTGAWADLHGGHRDSEDEDAALSSNTSEGKGHVGFVQILKIHKRATEKEML